MQRFDYDNNHKKIQKGARHARLIVALANKAMPKCKQDAHVRAIIVRFRQWKGLRETNMT